jgi:hypothetical protein
VKYSPKIQEAIDQGKLWRAKEILGSQLSQSDYQTELYEQYGSILLKMNDDLNAGLYLFLSGTDNVDYKNAVELFLDRHGKSDWEHLKQKFPGKIKTVSIKLLPEKVQVKLIELGMPENHESLRSEKKTIPLSDKLFTFIAVLFSIAVIIFIVVGIVETFNYIFR